MFQKEHILYEDRQLLVCYKQAGFPVQTSRVGSMDLESALKAYLAEEMSKQDSRRVDGTSKQDGRRVPYLGLINRLDQPVEGLVLFARTRQAAAALSRQLQEGKIGKEYLAMVSIGPEAEFDESGGEHLLVDDLRKEPKGNLSRIAAPGEAGAKQARLTWSCVSRRGELALLRIHLLTGRHHQIRVQLAHAHMPICGDTKYGVRAAQNCEDTKYGVNAAQNDGWQQIALCAAELRFLHPETHKEMEFSIKPQNPIFQKVTP